MQGVEADVAAAVGARAEPREHRGGPMDRLLKGAAGSGRLNLFSQAAVVLWALILVGCGGTSVAVRTEQFPDPVVPQLPLHIGVHFTESFSQHRLQETVPQRGDWSIDVGAAQVAMLRTVLPGMFQQVTEIETWPDEAAELPPGIDAILVPQVEDMQFSIPAQTRSNFFEFWVRYRMTLQTASGEEIGTWPVTAYGKTRDLMLERSEAAMREAAVNALRDAGAFLAIGFPSQQEIQHWLDRRLADNARPSDRSDTTRGGES